MVVPSPPTASSSGGPGRRAMRLAALVLGGLMAVLAAELVMHLAGPYRSHRAARELAQFRRGGRPYLSYFTTDPEIGYRPRIGPESGYSEWGTRLNDYPLERRPGVRRLLFIGDSVTFRGRIIDAIRARRGDARFEYWNAGVEGFNTLQEVIFYRRYNAAIRPDHVILTFHLNDFRTTPVAFVDGDGQLVVYTTHRPRREVNQLLFRLSHLYRLWLGLTTDRTRALDAVTREVRGALVELRDLVTPSARLTVLVHPVLTPPSRWRDDQRQAHATVCTLLDELGIRHVDLLPVLERALDEGVEVGEAPGDDWHPSSDFAALVAAHLDEQGLLAAEP